MLAAPIMPSPRPRAPPPARALPAPPAAAAGRRRAAHAALQPLEPTPARPSPPRRLLTPQDGNASPMLALQKEWLNDNGVLSNENLYHVVQAISFFRGGGQEDQ